MSWVNYFRKLPLRRAIRWIVLTSVLLVTAASVIGFVLISGAYRQELYETVASNLSQNAVQISNDIEEYQALADMILGDSVIQTELANRLGYQTPIQREDSRKNIYDELNSYKYTFALSSLSRLAIYQDGSYIYSSTVRDQALSEDQLAELEQLAADGHGSTIWITKYVDTEGLLLIRELRESKNLSLRHLGTLVIYIDPDEMMGTMNSLNIYDEPSFLLVKGEDVIYQSGIFTESGFSPDQISIKTGYQILRINGESCFLTSRPISKTGWTCIGSISYASINNRFSASFFLMFFCLLVAVSSGLILTQRFSFTISSQYESLIDQMKAFGSGSYTPPEDSSYSQYGDAEIGQLYREFDSMEQHVERLIQQNYVNEMLKSEAQLKALESQMDPHFLYNTLDSINWRAKAVGAGDICEITTALGLLLRTSLSRSKEPFTIAKEITIIENYMRIQQKRYSRRLEFTFDLPAELNDYEIPKFTIQPLLENAIRYGLETNTEVCQISVYGYLSTGKIIICVKNSGSQFEENALERLLSEDLQPHGFGIGISNIHKRLQIAYGPQYGLSLFNEEDEDGEEYAIARVTLPARNPSENQQKKE